MERINNWIDGGPKAPLDPKFETNTDSPREDDHFEVALSSEIDVVQAVRSAHQALKAWSRVEDRAAILARVGRRLDEGVIELAGLAAAETGRPFRYVRRDLADVLNSLDEVLVRAREDRALATPRAVGVIGVLTPKRDSLLALLKRVFPALAYGNTVVIKPSLRAPRVALRLGEILAEAGVSAGAYNVVNGAKAPVGVFLARHPGVARLAFVGTSARGAELLGEVAPLLKPVHLELSRKNTIVVLKDAEVTKITPMLARAAVDGFAKILVQDELYADLGAALASELGALKVGDARDAQTEVEALRFAGSRDAFEAAVALARREDGRVLAGGDGGKPVLIGELTNCSEIHQTDLAGPLITLNTFKYVTDAVKWANNTPFGGAASVWTKNLIAARKLIDELDFGAIAINGFPSAAVTNGLKTSGLGRLENFFFDVKSISLG